MVIVAIDPFAGHSTGLESPGDYAVEVTPSNTDELEIVARAIYVGTGGNLKITTVAGNTVTYKNIPNGTVIPIRTRKVWDTGTTAADLVAEW